MTIRETWMERISAWRASGLSAAKFCEGKEFSSASLYVWARRLRVPAADALPEIRLARVVRSAKGASVRALPSDSQGSGVTIELGGARICVGRGSDAATLTVVLEAFGWRAPGASR